MRPHQKRWRRIPALLSGLLAFSILLTAQDFALTPSPSPSPSASPAAQPPASSSKGEASPADVPLIKTNTRLVLIDVVVRGRNDQPVTGLSKDNFTVIEEGKPQQIKYFEEHLTPTVAPNAPPRPARVLPPNQYTNMPDQGPAAPLTVILLDTLNTPMIDQAYGRQQLLKFLKTIPGGRQAALFTLGTRLHVVQGFTGKTDQLVAAATRLGMTSSPLRSAESETQANEDRLVDLENTMGPAGAQLADNLRKALADQEVLRNDQRVAITLEALRELARSLSGYSGRKNLLWLSGGFPFSLGPDFNLDDPMRNLRSYEPDVRDTSGRLAAAQVAVYPIDIRGLVTTGVDITSSGSGSTGLNRRGGSRYGDTLNRQSRTLDDEHSTMNDIAEQTGGEAFYNTNGLATAMDKTIQQTATYYTIAYVPENKDWNGRFRKLNIKLDRRDARLDYRRGYFASQEQELAPKDSQRLLASAILPGTPDSTSLLFLARVVPPGAANKNAQIALSIDPRQVTFTDLANGRKHAMVDLLGIAWDKNGRDAGHFSATLDANMTPQTFAKVLRGGLPAQQELDLKPGSYHLRIGVMDRSTQNIGTIDVPLTVPN